MACRDRADRGGAAAALAWAFPAAAAAALAGSEMTAAPVDFLRRRGRLHAALSSLRSGSALVVSPYSRTVCTCSSASSSRPSTPALRSAAGRRRRRDVVVVGIDDTTFSETGLRWPFPRSVQVVFDRLTAAGAKR